MRPVDPVATLALLLALLVPVGLLAGDTPYVVGSEDDPERVEDRSHLGPELVRITLIRTHRYSERFSVESVAVSADGREIAALSRVSREGPKSWDFATGRPLELPPMPGNATVLAYSGDMRSIAAAVQDDVLASERGGVDVYALKDGRAEPRLTGGDDAKDLAFSPDDRTLLAATGDGLIGWELDRGTPLEVVRVPGGADLVAFISASEVLVGSGGGSILMRVALDSGEVAETWEGRGGRAACVSPDGRFAAIGAVDKFRILDLWSGGEAQIVPVDGEVASLDWGSSGEVLAVGTAAGAVLVFGVEGVRGLSRGAGETRISGSRAQVDDDAGPDPDRGRKTEREGDERSRRDERPGRDETRASRSDDRDRWDADASQEERPDYGNLGRDEGRGEPGNLGRERGGGETVVAEPEPKIELVAEVTVLILDSFGNDPRTSTKLEKSLRTNLRRLEPCWKREARKDASVVGQVLLPMSVSAEGEGRAFGDPVEDTIGNEKLVQCVQDKLRGNVFPPGLGTLDVELTLAIREELQ
jgi:hypothetical protein